MPRRACKDKVGQKLYKVKSKRGAVRTRCLAELCKRSKNRRFHYKRGDDGKCGKIDEGLTLAQLKDYEEYKKNRRRK